MDNNTPRRIVFLIPSLDIGGAERQLVELASGMLRTGWQVTVLTFYGGGALEADLISRGVTLQVLNKRGRWDLVGFLYRLLRSIRRTHPDILHAYLVTPNLISVLMKALCPGTKIVWGVRASNVDFRHYVWIATVTFHLSRAVSRFADLIICNSEVGRRFYASHGYPSGRMVVIHNGIDSDQFRPDAISRVAVRREWGIGDECVLVGMVGRLDPMKDHTTFLRAAVAISAERPDVRFVCLGDGPEPYRTQLKDLALSLGLDDRLTWTGSRFDMARVYNSFDLLVSSSSWGEGFPNVVAEAMATGVPCVVTNVGDSAQVVGDAGWVCRPHEPRELARAVLCALASSDILRAYGKRAQRRALAEFSVARLVEATSQQLGELLAGTS